MSILGTRVIRTEDPRLLTSGGVYVDDLREPELAGAVRATFVRSPVAHALITGIDASAALEQPGVVAVLTVADMTDMPDQVPPEPEPEGVPPAEGPMPLGGLWAEPLLAVDRVRFVGEPVALVLTDSTYQGEDAAELVSVDYEPLPAVASIDAALAGGEPALPRGRQERLRPGPRRGQRRIDLRRLRGHRRGRRRQPAGRLPAPGGPVHGRGVGGRQADGLGVHPERADRAADPDRHRAAAGGDPGGRAGRGRRVRRQDRHRPRVDRRRLGGQAHRPAGALGGDPQREHGRDDPGPRAAAPHQDRRQQGRAHQGLPPRRRPGHRRLPADVRLPADADQPDGAGRLRHPRRPGGLQGRGHRRDADRRLPGRRPSGGRRHHRAGGGLVRRRGRGRPRAGAQAQLHQERSSSRSSPRRGRPTTPATTRAPWTRCSPPPGTRSSGPSSDAAARRATPGSSASGWRPTWRSPRPTAPPARPRRSRSTTTAPRPSTPAAPPTARGTTPRSR